PVHVPAVVGLQLPDAEAQLRAAGFEVAVSRKDDETKPRDYVLDQDPPGGQGLASANGQTVTLVVANGPPGIPMPDMRNIGCADAENQLKAMGLSVVVHEEQPFAMHFGKVRDQQPQPGEQVPDGQQVQ